MGYGKINLWVRDINCNLVPAWRMDLVIQKCNGTYIVDFDDEIIPNLQANNPGYTFTIHDYMGYRCIKILPPSAKKVNHINLLLPSNDSYKIFARMCHSGNEWTNKIYVTVKCEEVTCVTLLLNTESLCVKNDVLPVGVRAVQKGLDNYLIQEYLRLNVRVGMIPKQELLAAQDQRIADLADPGAPQDVLQANQDFRQIIFDMPDEPLC